MPTAKEIYFSNNNIKLEKKFYVKRKYKIPLAGEELLLEGNVPRIPDLSYNNDPVWSADVEFSDPNSGTYFTIGKIVFNNYSSFVANKGTEESKKNTLYKLEFDVLNYTSGKIYTYNNAGRREEVVSIQANTHYSLNYRSYGEAVFEFKNFTGALTNFSLKKLKLYEDDWQDITQYSYKDSFSISKNFDYKSWEFGQVQQDDCSFNFLNLHGEISDEDNINSIFHNGYIRHYSKIKAEILLNGIATKVFEGLIDDRTAKTEEKSNNEIIESFSAFSYIKMLENVSFGDAFAGWSQDNTMRGFVYGTINNGYFQDYFNINFSLITVPAILLNVRIDKEQYDTSSNCLDVIKDLSKGHSVFYIDQNNNFIFKPYEQNSDLTAIFDFLPERKLKVYDYVSGADRVIENFYWKDSTEKFEVENPIYNTKEEVDIIAITETTDRQAILDYLGSKFSARKPSLKIDIPLCPFINIFDKVKIITTNLAHKNKNFILDVSQLDVACLGDVYSAVNILDKVFYVVELNHSDYKTTLTLFSV